jgi:hypothetical protein
MDIFTCPSLIRCFGSSAGMWPWLPSGPLLSSVSFEISGTRLTPIVRIVSRRKKIIYHRGAAGTDGAPATWEPLRSTPQRLHQARQVLPDDAPRSHGVNGVRNGPHPDGRRKRGVERPGAFRPHRKTLIETRNF